MDPTGKLILYAKGVSETFKKDFEKTTQMLKEKGCGNMLDRLNDSKIVFYIAENNKDSNSFNSSTNTISWNPRKGLYTNKDAFLSPATRLNHELGHAVNYLDDPQEYHKNIETQIEGDDETYTVEEKNVIEGIESETAISLGEINQGETTRNDHNGVTFDTDSPLSNKPINRFEVIILNKHIFFL